MQPRDELEASLAAGGGGDGDGGGQRSGMVSQFPDKGLCLVSQIALSKISVEAQGPRSCWAWVRAASGCCWASRGQV